MSPTPPSHDAERTLAVPADYDLWQVVRFLHLGTRDPTARARREGYAFAAWFPGGPATVQAVQRGAAVHARAWGPGAAGALDLLPQRLGLHDTPVALTPVHPELDALARRHRGLRLGRVHDLAACLVPTVLQQKVTWQDATGAWRELVRRFGEPAPGPLGLRIAPPLGRLAELGPNGWRLCGVPQRRAMAAREVARRARRIDRIVADAEGGAVSVEDRRRLTSLPGVGPWTLESALGNYHGDPDAFPPGDAHLPNAVAWLLAGEPRGDDARMFALLAPWAGQRQRILRLIWAEGVHAPRWAPKLAPRRDPKHLAGAALPRRTRGGGGGSGGSDGEGR